MSLNELVTKWRSDLQNAGPLNKKDLRPERFITDLQTALQQQSEAVAWRISYASDGVLRVAYCGHNAIADYRAIDPNAVSDALFTHPPKPVVSDEMIQRVMMLAFTEDDARAALEAALSWSQNSDTVGVKS